MAALRLSTRLFYPLASARVCVSAGVAEDSSRLSGLPRDRFEVVVVDDASTDDTPILLAEIERSTELHLRVVRQKVNGGPAAARNAGWRVARADLVAFVDDDCTPEAGWLAALERAFARNDRLGVVQGRTTAADGPRGAWTVAREISSCGRLKGLGLSTTRFAR